MGYRRRPLSAAVARFFMHIIGIVVYGTAITAARAVGLNSGSGQHNNDTIAKHNLNNNFEDAAEGGEGRHTPFPPLWAGSETPPAHSSPF